MNLRSLARGHTELCLKVLAGIVQNGQNDATRVAAAAVILDRGWGRPQTAMDPDGGDIVVTIREIVTQVGAPREVKTIEHDDEPPQLARAARDHKSELD